MITIIDYGLGNVKAFTNMYKRMNIEVHTARSADDLAVATHIILPGVGHFDHAMEQLDKSGMRGALDDAALFRKVPVVGICVGMQILAEGSDEGARPGLGWIPGRVRSMANLPLTNSMPLPHMGWNDVSPLDDAGLFSGLKVDARFYFLHSYYFVPASDAATAAVADYGGGFSCAVSSGNIHGVQFHPEKSHHWGARLLRNFAEF